MTRRKIALRFLLIGLCCTGISCDTAKVDKPKDESQIVGAGATFPALLYKKWLAEYQKVEPGVAISYEAVGSGTGVERFMEESVDFGASDAAMSDEEISKVKRGVQLIPVVAGSIVLAYTVPGLQGDLKLKRDVYVDIFLGNITQWDDARIQEANPDLKLPDADIAVVARQDGSGTTYAFTNHLSAVSQKWRDSGPGTGKVVDWPGRAMLAQGNEGVAGRIKISQYSIGYVEYGIANRAGLPMASLENKSGKFVQPSDASGLATLLNTEKQFPDNLRAFFPDPDGKESYPIVTYSWLLLYKEYEGDKKLDELKKFVRWCLTDGQELNESLGYIRLAPPLASRGIKALDSIH